MEEKAQGQATELTVSIKTIDGSYKQKFLLYEPYTLQDNDPIIQQCIHTASQTLRLQPSDIEDVKIRALLVIK